MAVVSIGPGALSHMIPQAREALESSQVVVGYRTYIEILQPLLKGKEVISTGMRGEVERCQLAIDRARQGRRVALVSSGDAGIYGMAGLVLEICKQKGLRVSPYGEAGDVDFHLRVIPGVSALAAAAAPLGAPLMHDFTAISLSDLLTPWETIQKRVSLAAQGDFVVVFYNPKSKRRDWQLKAACELLLQYRSPLTPVGIVRHATREDQSVVITSLDEIMEHPVDMQTIIIVGNSTTYVYGPYMVTPRGYGNKYDL